MPETGGLPVKWMGKAKRWYFVLGIKPLAVMVRQNRPNRTEN